MVPTTETKQTELYKQTNDDDDDNDGAATGSISAIALHGWQATGDDEITFNPGDVIEDIDEIHEDWWMGTINGKRGVFPENFVKKITAAAAAAASALECMNVEDAYDDSMWYYELAEQLLVEWDCGGDGNCQYRAAAFFLYNDEDRHYDVRAAAMAEMRAHPDLYDARYIQAANRPFSTLEEYIMHQGFDTVWGDDLSLTAIGRAYSRDIEVFSLDNATGKMQTNIRPTGTNEHSPLRLGYKDGNHYVAILDFATARAGSGAGADDADVNSVVATAAPSVLSSAETTTATSSVDITSASKLPTTVEMQMALVEKDRVIERLVADVARLTEQLASDAEAAAETIEQLTDMLVP